MDSTSKPLFNQHLLQREIAGFNLSLTDRQRQAIAEWATAATDPMLRKLKEKPLQGLFLTSLFDQVLGFTQVIGHADAYHMKAESASKEVRGGKTPDATLGFYGSGSNMTLAAVELKAPGADLNARQTGYGGLTPVEQAFGYVPKFEGCKWVIVSNFVTIRLYRTARGEGYYHEFRVADLLNEEALKQFVFLLGRNRLLDKPDSASAVERLAAETHTQEERITREFYGFYKKVRQRLFQQLVADNASPEGTDQAQHERLLLEKAQKVLDRVLFICFCEDSGLLPYGVIRQATEAAGKGFVVTTKWEQLIGLFRAIDRGRSELRINGYNGGLFAQDIILDSLRVDDAIISDLLRLSEYDFGTDLNVNILGRIFEQSIADLEAMHAEIEGGAAAKKLSKRKEEGVFYTPEFITRFIVQRTVGSWLDERLEELRVRHDPERVRGKHKKLNAEIQLWLAYQDVLRRIRVLDPACGSGAFLVAAFDYLHAESERVNRKLAALQSGQASLFDIDRHILQQNLYGVDVNAESIEITKLSLWLKTARTDKPLTSLDGTIKWGDSLVAPPEAVSGANGSSDRIPRSFNVLPERVRERAFDWRMAFPEVFEAGGFDCIIGNPPYVRQETIAPLKPYLEQT